MLSKRSLGAGTNRSFRISVNKIGIRITGSSKRRIFGTSAVENLREAGGESRAPALIKLGNRGVGREWISFTVTSRDNFQSSLEIGNDYISSELQPACPLLSTAPCDPGPGNDVFLAKPLDKLLQLQAVWEARKFTTVGLHKEHLCPGVPHYDFFQ